MAEVAPWVLGRSRLRFEWAPASASDNYAGYDDVLTSCAFGSRKTETSKQPV
jgi:hypothetical protein